MSDSGIALIGVVIGALIGAITAWVTSKSQQAGESERLQLQEKSETERLQLQLKTEWERQNQLAWQQRFMETIAELIGACDPEANPQVDKKVVVPLIHKAQLCLNLNVAAHARCNEALNRYAIAANARQEDRDERKLLLLQSDLFESARNTMWLPGRVTGGVE